MAMTTAPSLSIAARTKFENAAEWWHALGEVPLERIITDPPPGTATEKDLLWFVDAGDRLVELVGGTLVGKPPGFFEAVIAARVTSALVGFVSPERLGVVTGASGPIRMACGHVRLPTAAFVSMEDLRTRKFPLESIPTLPPKLVVEVLRNGNTDLEMRLKLKEYFESGTRLAWIIDPPKKTLAVYTAATEKPERVLSEQETVDGGDVLPGFTLRIAELFPDVP